MRLSSTLIRAITITLGTFITAFALPTNASKINLTFGTGFSGNLVRQGVATAAAQWWEMAIPDPNLVIGVTVNYVDGIDWLGKTNPNGAVGRMVSNTETAVANAATGTKLPLTATVELNSNAAVAWFFDTTPTDNSEFDMTMENGLFGNAKAGGGTGGNAVGKYDALAVLKHEVGHGLGFSQFSGNFCENEDLNCNDLFNDGIANALLNEVVDGIDYNMDGDKLDMVSEDLNGNTMFEPGDPFSSYTDYVNNFNLLKDTYTFDTLVLGPNAGKEGNKTGAGGAAVMVPFDSFHIDGTAAGNPAFAKKLMAVPGFGQGQRSLQTPLDIDIIGDAFNLAVNDMPHVPLPPAVWLFGSGLIGLIGIAKKRKVA